MVNVEKVFRLIGSSLIIPMFILERNLINASFVHPVLPVRKTIVCMKGVIQMIRKNSDVIYVGKAFCLIGSFLIIPMSILERNLTNANFVLNALPVWGHVTRMKEVILRNSDVINVAKAFRIIASFLIIPMSIMERNLINANFVLPVFPVRRHIGCMKGVILMIRKNSDVIHVTKAF